VPHVDGFVYDPGVQGGTTTIEVDRTGGRVREFVSLAGTDNNCAGGRTPWNTWLSCEETESKAGSKGRTKDHGYVFEVDPYDNEANRDPKPLKLLGRFAHEAVAVDPGTGVIFETEDAGSPNGLFYRWTPPGGTVVGKGVLQRLADDAGTLAALKASIDGTHVPDLSVATEPGTTYDVEWLTVPDRDAQSTSIRKQFTSAQITRSRKLEGMWWGDGGAYFVASFARTTDGSAAQHDGQVWFYDPLAETIRLVLRFADTPVDQDSDVDGPDNITVSPYGGVIMAEDGDGRQHLVGSSVTGETYFLARNDHPDSSEMTGPNFSPDKKTLFANIQSPGYVLAITGPWMREGTTAH
jgi:secreted PhoX family phosphatase